MIIRIDDYPTGVRPVTKEMIEDFNRILQAFTRYGMEIHLGIVPKTFQQFGCKAMDLPGVVPCVHGFDHLYPEKSRQLIEAKDPYNRQTIGNFDEYEGQNDRKVIEKLKYGRIVLEQEFGRPVDTYIPVCNVLTERLAKLLQEAGYTRILCQTAAASPIPILKSEYYGTLENLDMSRDYAGVCFHVTWEWDTMQQIGWEKWEALVAAFAKKYHQPVVPYHILFKFPIRYRKDKFFQTLDLYYQMIEDRENFEFLITIDADDAVMNDSETIERISRYPYIRVEIAQCTNKIEAVNYGVAESEGWDIVVVVSDDMIPKVKGFDQIIRRRMYESFPYLDGALWFNDGFQRDQINTLQILGRKWFDRWGFIYHPAYVSQRCDVEFQITAKKFNRIRYFDQVIIRHEHADFGLVPYDKLLLHNYTFIKRDELVFIDRQKLGFPVGIPKIAHFIWNEGTPLNYMRFLTYQTFKNHHPEWKVMFHRVHGCSVKPTWKGKEQLEFAQEAGGVDYLTRIMPDELYDRYVEGLLPNYASDLIRWSVLYEFGGFYFDLDQLILKPFDDLCDWDIVWGGDRINYSGVMGMFKRCPIALEMKNRVEEAIRKGLESYCDAGNWLWSAYVDQDATGFEFYKIFRTPMYFFYPVEESYQMQVHYEGQPVRADHSYALHWFGGHPDSQQFVKLGEKKINQILKQWNLNL